MLDLKSFSQKYGLDWDVELTADETPVLDTGDEEELSSSYSHVDLIVGDDGATAGTGTVHLTTRRVIWVAAPSVGSNNPDSSTPAAAGSSRQALSCTYKQISMHAVSRNDEGLSKPCVYIQIDEGSEVMADDDEDDEQEDTEAPLTAELRLVPADEAQVEPIFAKLCECSALNPDSDMEEEAGAQLFFDEAEVMAGLPDDQRAALLAARAEGALGLTEADVHAELDELMAADPGRFEDSYDDYEDEDEEDEAGHVQTAANGNAS